MITEVIDTTTGPEGSTTEGDAGDVPRISTPEPETLKKTYFA